MTSADRGLSARYAVRFANAAHFYAHLFMLIYPTAVLVLGVEFGLPYGELLSLSLPGYVLFGIAALPAGWLGDRWSSNGMMALFFIGTGLSAILTGLTNGPWQLLAGLALIGLFASIYHPVGTAIIVANAPNRGRSLGYNGVFGNIGIASAPLITTALISLIDWRAAFILPGAFCIATGVGFLWLCRGRSGRAETVQPAADQPVARADAVRGLLILAVTTLSVGLIAQATMVSLPKLFEVRVTFLAWAGLMGTGGLVTVALVLGGLGQFIGGHLADRIPLKAVYVAMYAAMVPVALLVSSLTEAPLVGAAAATMFLLSMSLPAENSLVARYCPAGWRASVYGAKFVLALGVSSLAVPIAGLIFDATGDFAWVFVTVAGFAGLIAALGLFLPAAGRNVARETAAAEAAE